MTNYARGHGWRYTTALLAIAVAALMLVSAAAAADDGAKFKGFGGEFPPVANFTANTSTVEPVAGVLTGDAPMTVNFWDLSNESITSWQWEFGADASIATSTAKNPVVTWTKPGTYKVTLLVRNATGFRDIESGESPVITTNSYKVTTIQVNDPGFTAEFDIDPSMPDVFAGYPLKFTDETIGGEATSWLWNFGDGTAHSTVQNPVHAYQFAGTYVASLTVNGPLGQSFISHTITVLDPIVPTAAFTTNYTAQGFPPLAVQFTDTSAGYPTEWKWEFGDGKTSTVQNPAHVFDAPGSYLVNLTASTSAGDNTYKNATAIVVLGSTVPDAAFTANDIASADTKPGPTVAGNAPFTVTFKDVSVSDATTSPATAWLWNFGDGTTSTTRNITHTYSTPGSYLVQFTTSTSAGAASAFVTVQVGPTQVPIADFVFNDTPSAANGATWSGFEIVAGGDAVWFNSTSTNGPQTYQWIFSDGKTFSEKNFSRTFDTAGDYWVFLQVSNNAGFGQKMNQFKVIPRIPDQAPVAGFTMIQDGGTTSVAAPNDLTVVVPAKVNFTNASSGGTPATFKWIVDGAQYTTQNATYTFDTPGTFPVTFIVSNADGTSSITGNVIAAAPSQPPTRAFEVSPGPYVAPAEVQFTYTQALERPATEWLWNFGDGTTSDVQNPTHIYQTPGTYSIRLTVTNSFGSQTSDRRDIEVVPLTAPGVRFLAIDEKSPGAWISSDAAYDTTLGAVQGQAPLTVNFTDVSTPASTSWLWSFGDGTTATTKNVTHTYTTPNKYSVQLLVTNAAGTTSTFKQNFVVVSQGAPVTDFTATPSTGSMPLTVQFADKSLNAPTAWAWVFGDGATSVSQNPTHTYTTAGEYTVSLTTWNAVGAGTTKTMKITVEALGPSVGDFNWTPEAPIAGEPVTFMDQSTNDPSAWWWIINGESKDTKDVTYTFAAPGTYTATLLVKNPVMTGWANPVTKLITVAAPVTTEPTTEVTTDVTTTVTTEVTTDVTTEVTTIIGGNQPYNGPHNVPGRVEAEDYDVTAGYPAYSDTTAANEGGAYRPTEAVDIEVGGSNFNVGWIRAGEFLTYSVDSAAAGTYNIQFRVANPGAAKTVTVSVNGAAKSLTIPATGGFTKWQTATLTGVSLNAGRNIVKVDMGNAASFNFDYMEFVASGSTQPTTVVTTTTTTQAPSGGATFMAAPNPVKKSNLIRFTLTPASGKTIKSAWWTFDKVGHYNTWNSRNINPGFYYPATGTFTPLVKITYTDGTTEEVYKTNYVTVTK